MNEAVVEALRMVLALAEAGEVTSVAIATVAPDLSTGSAYKLGDGTMSELLGSIELMKFRLMRQSLHQILD